MALSYDLEPMRTALEDVLHRLLATVESASEYDLLGASLCHGWSRLEVVVHLLGGWQEMLGGMVSPVQETPTVDAASYWTAFADDFGGEDPVEVLMAQRRRASSYARPPQRSPSCATSATRCCADWP